MAKSKRKPVKVPEKPPPKKSPPAKKPDKKPDKKPVPAPRVPIKGAGKSKKKKTKVPGKINWDKVNPEAVYNPEISVLRGYGAVTGLYYAIYLLKSQVWLCSRIQSLWEGKIIPAKSKVVNPIRGAKDLKNLVECKQLCEMWEGEDIVAEEIPAPPPEIKQEEGVKKYGSQVKEREWEGMSPEFRCKFKSHAPGWPKKIEIKQLIEWLEKLIDAYYERGIWLCNSGLRDWMVWLREDSGKAYTQGERDLITKTLSDCIRNRDENPEWHPEARQKAMLQKLGVGVPNEESLNTGEDDMATKKSTATKKKSTATTSAIVMKASTKKVEIEVGKGKKMRKEKAEITTEVGTGARGGARYKILGLPMAAVLRWMGADGWTWHEAKAVLHGPLGMKAVLDSTIKVKVYNGKAKTGPGEIPDLSSEQVKTLRALKAKATK